MPVTQWTVAKKRKNAFLLFSQFTKYKGSAACFQASYSYFSLLSCSNFFSYGPPIFLSPRVSDTKPLRSVDQKTKQTPGWIQKCCFSNNWDCITIRSGSLFFILKKFTFAASRQRLPAGQPCWSPHPRSSSTPSVNTSEDHNRNMLPRKCYTLKQKNKTI